MIAHWHVLCYNFHNYTGKWFLDGRRKGLSQDAAPGGKPNTVEDVMNKMRRLWIWLMGCALMLPVLMPSLALAAKKKADVVIVADTRKLDGLLYWWAEMYNESHFFFAILTMIIIPILGTILGLLADVVMRHIGIDLEHRELAEK